MSIRLDSKQVLDYLKELGYNNISPKQLKEFMKDLKKLIKYEERKSLRQQVQEPLASRHSEENVQIWESMLSYDNTHSQENVGIFIPDPSGENKEDSRKDNTESTIYQSLCDKDVQPSKSRETQKKESIISVQIKRPSNVKISRPDYKFIEIDNDDKRSTKHNVSESKLTDVSNYDISQLTRSVTDLDISKTADTQKTIQSKARAKSATTIKQPKENKQPVLRPKSSCKLEKVLELILEQYLGSEKDPYSHTDLFNLEELE